VLQFVLPSRTVMLYCTIRCVEMRVAVCVAVCLQCATVCPAVRLAACISVCVCLTYSVCAGGGAMHVACLRGQVPAVLMSTDKILIDHTDQNIALMRIQPHIIFV